MDSENEQPVPDERGSSGEPAPRVRLPGYDPPPDRGPAYDWPGYEYWPPRAYPGYPPDGGIRRSRRASTWTAAALIAGVAATTDYLAHAMPAPGATSRGTARPATSPVGTVSPSAPAVRAPAVHPPVVTSGGSGAAGGGDN